MDNLSKTVAAIPAATSKRRGIGRWKPVFLALSIPLGLLLILGFVFREQLERRVDVEMGRVILLEQSQGAEATSIVSAMLFQASGWVEPDPWAVNVAVKQDGFIERVFVTAGQTVSAGQTLATLDAQDMELELAQATANVQNQNAQLRAQQAAVAATEKWVEQAQFEVEAVQANLLSARDTWKRYAQTPAGAISLNERVASEQAVVELEAAEKGALANLKAREAQRIQADAGVEVERAALAAAQVAQAVAELALERTQITAPFAGIVLRRYVQPGDKRMAGADDPNSAAVVSLYDPALLQVRVDVPLAEAGKMRVGQPARIATAMLPGQTFTGRITRIVGEADLQRNTLQAKVQIDEPDARLRPDVLCRVEFWSAAESSDTAQTASGRHTLWVPNGALVSDQAQTTLWVVDPVERTLHARSIELASAQRDGFRQVKSGLRANEQVVLHPTSALSEGTRVKEVQP